MRLDDQPKWLGKDRPESGSLVSMQNGILDLEAVLSGQVDPLRPHTPQWFSPVCLPYPFDPSAGCPGWLSFLQRNLEGDAERIAVLQEWFGYCLTIDTCLQKFLLVVGEGANGKSVACAALTALLGEANVSAVPLESFGQRFQLYATFGRLANIVPEVGELDRVAEGCLKSFTSGDRMLFERKHRNPFEAEPTARLVLATNNLPRFSDRSGGLWRRMILMPFNVQIPESERIAGLDKTSYWVRTGEASGIFNWALEGLLRLRRNGEFTKSSTCAEALATYRTENNPARCFLLEFCRADPQGEIITADVYKRYATWCESNGHRPLASSAFGKEIVRAFPHAEKAKVRGGGTRKEGYKGVCAS